MKTLPLYLSLDDVLLIPRRSHVNSRADVDLSWSMDHHHFSLPLISSNMDCVTGVDMAIAMGKLGGLSLLPRFDLPHIQVAHLQKIKAVGVPVAASIGIKPEEWDRLKLLIAAGVDHINVDVAHGHLIRVLDFVARIRTFYPHISLSAGVVGTYEAARDLFLAGADIVRVGVGPGNACTTRLQAGSGVPQFTALTECARAARKYKKIIWADGGTRNSGDIVKCLAAGASAVIVGYQFAGTDEAPPAVIIKKGKKYKPYNGSTSLAEKLRQIKKMKLDKPSDYAAHVEGVEKLVPYRGPVKEVVEHLIAGIRSGYSYSGAHNTPELWRQASFAQITSLGAHENATKDGTLI